MNQEAGKYIVLEGGEAAGKTTQLELLREQLGAVGVDAVIFPEPGGSEFGAAMREVIKYGPKRTAAANVLAFNAARADSLKKAEELREQGKWILADRSYLSTIVYQGHGEGMDIDSIRTICEFAVGDMKPDATFILDVDATTASERREQRGTTDHFEKMDDAFHERVREGFATEAKREGLPIIDASEPVQEVHQQLWKRIEPMLSKKAKGEASTNQLIEEKDGQKQLTPAGKRWLEKAVTDTEGDVYVFTGEMDPVMVAAAMARLSRNANDMRVILADEFSGDVEDAEGLLHRVITAYGDDSVQQLTGVHLVVEDASNLLTKKLEWGRLAAYLEQSTRYIYFDKPNKHGEYRYHTPSYLAPEHAAHYDKTMDELFTTYSGIVKKLTNYVRDNSSETERDGAWKAATRAQACDAARPLLPVATTSTVGIFASGQALEAMIMRLRAEELPEMQQTGQAILDQSRQVLSTFLERADKPSRGGATSHYLQQTRRASEAHAAKLEGMSIDIEPVKLVDVSMRNELDVVPFILAEHGDKSLDEIAEEISGWSHGEKLQVFKDYVGERLNRRHKPGRAFEHINYTWEIICDYGIFRDLQRHRMVDGLTWQQLTPRYGFETPQLVSDAGLEDQFEAGFDLSFELFSYLQHHGYHDAAQYATLMGHKMRWKIGYNARQAFHFHELRTAPQGHPGYRKLVGDMHNRLAEVHPHIAASMKFVNQGEDEELTRLAAERYTQSKLATLDSKV